MTVYKLSATEAADLIVEVLQNDIKSKEANIAEIRTELDSLRKNSKERPRYERAIQSLEGHIEVKRMRLAEAIQVQKVASEMFELTERIAELCQQRRDLTPGIGNAEIHLLSAMRNGFHLV